MPRLTRWYLRSSLIYLVVALFIGLVLAARPILGLPPSVANLRPVFFHLFVVGWITQLIFGVVYWMFPKYSGETPYRSVKLAWTTFILLNIGLLARALIEPTLNLISAPIWSQLLTLSATLQFIASVAFVINSWARVKVR
jgi:hypothetical protein